jgi:hypothetical protein
MNLEDQKTLFQPFVQIRAGELQKGRGSGLGLTICKTLVVLHGGVMGFESKERVGSDVTSGGTDFFFSIKFDIPGEDIILKNNNNRLSTELPKEERILQPIGMTLCCDGLYKKLFYY